MYRISADYIFTPEGFVKNHCLETDEEGRVFALRPLKERETSRRYEGIICPGFVNAHCHLELSFLRGKIPEATGMTGFASQVMQLRKNTSEAERMTAIFDGLREAFYTGTVAIGDICNSLDSAEPKRAFPELYTHSFIELLGLDGDKAEEIIYNGRMIQGRFTGLPSSLTLHAPYSVSEVLRDRVYEDKLPSLSIHLLESKAERALFQDKSGPFYDFYEKMSIPFQGFSADSPQAHILKGVPAHTRTLLVHNTEMEKEELGTIARQFPHAWFCLCPRSNQYIHGTLPDVEMFLEYSDRICLGTDSLASNASLGMLEEIKTLKNAFQQIPLHTLLVWATVNGAAALQQSDNFGMFAPGSKCGVNLIEEIHPDAPELTSESVVRKLF